MGNKTKKILVVDDEEDMAYFLKANLELEGEYEVITVTKGKDAFRTAAKHMPDLIMLDIKMPQVDGIQVLKKLKESPKTLRIPVIILSAKTDDATKIEAARLYDDHYITKPVQIEEIKSKIKEVLERYQA